MNSRIVIAEDEPITRLDLKQMLKSQGYNVVGEAADGFDVIEVCRNHNPDLVIMDIKMPLLDGLSASKIIMEEKLASAIILLTAYSNKEFIEKAKNADIMGYLVKPIDEARLIPTVELVLNKSKKIESMQNKIDETIEKLETRKIVEKAKGILMKSENISEDEAYLKIRNISMQKRKTMKYVSKLIILKDSKQ